MLVRCNPRPSLPLSCDRPANHPFNPVFRARVRSTHAREFQGPNAAELAEGLGLSEDAYWDIVEGGLPYNV